VAVVDAVTARELGRAYAEAVRDEPAAKRLWARPNRGEVELWLLVDESADIAAERRLYGAGLILHDRFPEPSPFILVINPSRYDPFDLGEVIPRDAEEIPLPSGC
jgi:hypothetical protein